jgi:DNA topoisomerase-2
VEEDTVFISELPVGTWTGYLYYKKFLEELVVGKVDDKGKQVAPPLIKEYQMTESEVKVMITVRFLSSEQLDDLERTTYANGVNGVEKLLALTTTYGTQNMMLFDTHCKLKNYETVESILDEFYVVRYDTYRKRKAHLIRAMQGALKKMANKARFIQEIVAGHIDLRKSQNDGEVDVMLEQKGFDRMASDGSDVVGEAEGGGSGGNYKYLTEMKLNTLTKERAEKLMRERDDAETQLRTLEATTLETMWLRELDSLESQYTEDRAWRIQLQNPEGVPTSMGGNGLKMNKNMKSITSSKTKLRKG